MGRYDSRDREERNRLKKLVLEHSSFLYQNSIYMFEWFEMCDRELPSFWQVYIPLRPESKTSIQVGTRVKSRAKFLGFTWHFRQLLHLFPYSSFDVTEIWLQHLRHRPAIAHDAFIDTIHAFTVDLWGHPVCHQTNHL